MALKGQQSIVAIHPLAVVADANQPPPARLHLDANAAGPGVQRILQQLFHHRSRPVHNLARGNLVGNLVGKYANTTHEL